MTDVARLQELIRDIPDFHEPGILFRDITPLLRDVDAFRYTVDALADEFQGDEIDRVLGIEARGFLLAAPIAYRLGAGLVPVRKPGKLPHTVEREGYQLEYGDDALELHVDALAAGERCLVVDDVLATGGTA
ncbi:MAG TPA: adenine phosphoribosyltransferase, partial [Acidimicrobiales bacterium]|nr:adenine phosphoribosyltransferase [Acidimicrobiales bacterium]